jgi:hypothetical protein
MITIASLGPAIVMSSVLVWIASALIWTVLPWHKDEYSGLRDEDAALAALNPKACPPWARTWR